MVATETPPAYFLSITVENFRCFGPKQTLDLSKSEGRPAPWTIILGENGVGKTSLLQCLAVMQPLGFKIAPKDEPDNILLDAYIPSYMPAYNKHEKLYLQNWLSRFINIEKLGRFDCEVSSGRTLNGSEDEISLGKFSLYETENNIGFTPTFINIQGLICYGYGASRRMGTTSLSEMLNPDAAASLFSEDVELINGEEWLLQADYAASRTEGEAKVLASERRNRIQNILTRLLPDVNNFRYVQSEERTLTTIVEAETHYGWVPLQNLSLGYRTLITWMVDLAVRLFERYPHSSDPLAEPAIVLVDEIDLHLHPRLQRTLMQDLSTIFPNTQFIATAHSPLVVQAATDANIVLLRREGDHVVIDNDVERIRNWRVDQILTSDLFGLESARPPQTDDLMAERNRLLSQTELTEADQARLDQLEKEIGQLPTGETPEDIKAMDVIRQAAKLLEKS